MKKILFLILFLTPSVLFAATEKYSVERPDGGVSIIYYQTSSSKPLDVVVHQLGFDGLPIRKIQDSDIPKERTDRDSWSVVGKRIVVDSEKKKEIEDAKAEKETEEIKELKQKLESVSVKNV